MRCPIDRSRDRAALALAIACLAAGCGQPAPPLGAGAIDDLVAHDCRSFGRALVLGLGCVPGDGVAIPRLRRAIEEGRLDVDRGSLEACLRSTRFAYLEEEFARTADGCPGLWIPRTEIGAPCDTHLECIGGFCARASDDDYRRGPPEWAAAGCGTCEPWREDGESCSGHGWAGAEMECMPGSTCTDGVCARIVAPVAIGEACDPGAGVGCARDGFCYAGVCIRPREAGEPCIDVPCVRQHSCVGGVCVRGVEGTACVLDEGCLDELHCADGACAPRGIAPGSRAPGEECAERSHCANDLPCVLAVCRTFDLVGEECVTAGTGSTCVRGSRCDGVCVPLPTLGEPCAGACRTGDCVGGTCVSNGVAAGDACDAEERRCGPYLTCASGVCAEACFVGDEERSSSAPSRI